MTIAPFAFGVIACLAAQGAIYTLAIVTAAFVTAVKQSSKPKVITQILADTAPDGQK